MPMLTKEEGLKKRTDLCHIDPRVVKVVDGWNDRIDFTGEEDLMQSIISEGVKEPIKVQKVDGGLNLVNGERRLRAVMRAIKEGHEIQSVPAIIFNSKVNELDLHVEALVADTGKPLTPSEEASAFKRLVNWGLTPPEIARRIGRSKTLVRNRLELANLVPEAKEAVDNGEITMTDALEIAETPKVDEQKEQLDTAKKKKAKPKKATAVSFKFKEGTFSKVGLKGDTCPPIIEAFNNDELLNAISEAGFDPDTLRVTVKPWQEL